MRMVACSWVACLCLAAAGLVVRADGPPDAASRTASSTASVKELSVEEAKRLAGEQRGRLVLDGLTTLSDDAAKELAKREGWLSLNGLKTLSNAAAAALGGHKGYLFLDGLTTLSPEAGAALAQHGGYLSLNGITTLSDEAAQPLLKSAGAAGHVPTRGGLSLRGLTTLSPAAAEAFVGRKGSDVVLEGLTTLTPEVATILAKAHPHIWNGNLPRISRVSDELAQALAARPHGLSMPGLEELPPTAAAVLVAKLGGNLPKLTSLTPEVAAVLAKARGLTLDGVREMSDDVVKLIAATNGPLSLNGLRSLTLPAAELLGNRNADLSLNGVTEISPDVARKLTEHRGHPDFRPRVSLDGLTSFGDDVAAVIANWPKWTGHLPRLSTVSEPAAAALAGSRQWDGRLPAVKSFSAGAAKALAGRRGDLVLDGLTDLPVDVAAALAAHRGGELSLNGLKTLNDGAAAALAAHDGRLSLDGLTTLSDAAAKALASHTGSWLSLDGLATITPAAAKSLAGSTGMVSLRGLKPGDDATLAMLRAGGRVALPYKPLAATRPVAAADEKFVHGFLAKHCGECHGEDAEKPEGDFALDKPWPTMANVGGRVAYASILERLAAGDMPPPQVKERPDAAATDRVLGWIRGQLDTPLAGPPTPYAVKDKPIDGNRLPHAILFGGPRGPSVPPPPRLWRMSPAAYDGWLSQFNWHAGQQPFGLIMDAGIKDFAALYAPDEGASGLLLANADLLVDHQVAGNKLVNVKETPDAAKQKPWPNDDRIKTCTPEEQKRLESGVRVAGGGAFAPLMHPDVAATRAELESAIAQQFRTAVARAPAPAEVESLVKLYETVARDGDHRLAGKTVLMAPLMSPEVVLRFEVGLGPEVRPGVRMLSPPEIALAASLALGVKREAGLIQAAAAGGLKTREDVASNVRRILDTPSIAKPRVMQFFREYFGYHRAPDVFKDPLPQYHSRRGRHFDPRGRVMDSDARILAVLGEDRQVLARLLAGDEAFGSGGELHMNAVTSALSGAGAIFRTLPPHAVIVTKPGVEGRVGLLMDPAWLVAWSTNFHNDPVRRGRWIREQLLGGRVPDLPINAAAMIPDDPHRTLRERQSVTRADACWKCHYRMDDLGLPFEAYDHYGFAQDGEEVEDREAMDKAGGKGPKLLRNAPLDTTGLIANSGDPALDGPVSDAPEMLRRLAASERVRQVFVRHAFRFFMGRNETPGDAPSLQDADRAYVESDGSFKELLVSLLSSESFLCRTVVPPSAKNDTAKR